MRVMQWNCRGLIGKWASIKPFLMMQKCAAFCLQETHFLPNDHYDFSLPNYTRYDFFGNDDRRQGGVCIYASNSFPHRRLSLNSSLQAIGCSMRIGHTTMSLCSLYLPPNDMLQYEELNNLIQQLPKPLLLCTDANSRHMLWGSDRCDRRGMVWERLIRMHELCVLNNGSATRIDDYTGLYSHIDVTLTSGSLAPCATWQTDEDPHDSDHFPMYVMFDFDDVLTASTDLFYGWNLNKANWSEFRDKCILRFDEQLGVDNYRVMAEAILSAAAETVPKKTGQSKYSCPWWNDQCKAAIAERKRILNRFRRNREIPGLLLEYKRAKAKARQVIRQAKKDSWMKLLHLFSHQTPLPRLWEILRKFTKKTRYNRPIPVLEVGGQVIDDMLEVGNAFGIYFSSISSQENYSDKFRTRLNELSTLTLDFQSAKEECYNELFTLSELVDSVRRCGNTSVGPDTLHYAFFKHMDHVHYTALLKLFNAIWTTGAFPADWSHSYIVPILKPGKPASKPQSYRPIQLTSCMCKILERMVASRLKWYLEHMNILSPYQSAFRRGRCTVDHIARLETEIRHGFFYNKYTLALFLDFKSAYNLVSIPALLLKMYNLGFRGRLMSFVQSYLSRRTFQVKCGTLSQVFAQENGVVQGGVVSPILFNLMINDIFDGMSDAFSYALYADDCALWIQGRHFPQLARDMQNALDLLVEWADTWGFTFAPAKCNAVIFRRYMKRSELHNIPQLKIKGEVIAYSDHVKFLGVYLDSKLNMNKHVQYIRARALKRLPLLKCIAGHEYGADRAVLLKMYSSLIRPILEYACQILDGPANTAVNSLESVQNACLRVATGALRTSPVMSLQVESNVVPLFIRRWELTIRYALKVFGMANHPCQSLIDGTHSLPDIEWDYMKRISGFPLYERFTHASRNLRFEPPHDVVVKVSTIPEWKRHKLEFRKLFDQKKATMLNEEVKQAFGEFQNEHNGYQYIFTDGSKNEAGVGCAFVHGNVCQQTKLKGAYSIFTAEAVALLQALQYVTLHRLSYSVICTDSMSVLLALQSDNSNHPLLFDIKDALHGLVDGGLSCIILWVPGHCGLTGNETADYQAKHAILQAGAEEEYEVPANEYKSYLRSSCLRHFGMIWTTDARPTNLKQIKPVTGHWSTCTRSARREEIVLCRLRLGHTRLTHSFLLDHDVRPECDVCDTYLTVQHMLVECIEYAEPRRRLGDLCQRLDVPMELSTLLGNGYPEITDAVFTFLRDCDLFRKI